MINYWNTKEGSKFKFQSTAMALANLSRIKVRTINEMEEKIFKNLIYDKRVFSFKNYL